MAESAPFSPDEFRRRLADRFAVSLPMPTVPPNHDAEWAEYLIGVLGESPEDHFAHALAYRELEEGLGQLGIAPSACEPAAHLGQLIPWRGRRAAWNRLGEAMELKLPRLGAPPWLQSVVGASLLGSFVLMFFFLLWGFGLFWAMIAVLYGIERWLPMFSFPSLGAAVARIAVLNPELKYELSAQPEAVAALVADFRHRHFPED